MADKNVCDIPNHKLHKALNNNDHSRDRLIPPVVLLLVLVVVVPVIIVVEECRNAFHAPKDTHRPNVKAVPNKPAYNPASSTVVIDVIVVAVAVAASASEFMTLLLLV